MSGAMRPSPMRLGPMRLGPQPGEEIDRKRPFTTDCAIGAPPDEACRLSSCTHINVLIMK